MPASSEQLNDPYADPNVASSTTLDPSKLGPAFGGGTWGAGGPPAPKVPAASQPDFLFPENYDEMYRRSWGDRLTYHIGCGYLAGLVGGGFTGVAEGLRSSAGERQRIRINAVLNAAGKKGPAWGNGVGCLGMMFSAFETVAFNVRGTDDLLNVAGAGALAGGIYKSTAGLRQSGGAIRECAPDGRKNAPPSKRLKDWKLRPYTIKAPPTGGAGGVATGRKDRAA